MRAERSGGRHRSPLRLRAKAKASYRRLTSRSERAAPLTCSLRWRFFTLPPAAFASRACVSVRCITAGLISAESSLSGRFGAGALRPVGGEGARVTVFWRNAKRVMSALSVTRRYVYCSVEFGRAAVCIGSASCSSRGFHTRIIKPRRGQPVGALAASFWRRERNAEPTTMRSVLLSMRQGPVLVSKLTNVSVKTFASFVRVIHPLALPPRRSPA